MRSDDIHVWACTACMPTTNTQCAPVIQIVSTFPEVSSSICMPPPVDSYDFADVREWATDILHHDRMHSLHFILSFDDNKM